MPIKVRELREAVKEFKDEIEYWIIESKYKQNNSDYCKLRIKNYTTAISVLQSHIAAVESGVPEEREHRQYCDSRFNSNTENHCNCGAVQFNEARSLMLANIVDRDLRIKELGENSEDASRILYDTIKELKEQISLLQSSKERTVGVEEIKKVIQERGSPMNGVSWDYWIDNIAQAIVALYAKEK